MGEQSELAKQASRFASNLEVVMKNEREGKILAPQNTTGVSGGSQNNVDPNLKNDTNLNLNNVAPNN
eukprot:CAMPEP_0114591920 /NCGR_PEP_ID=MMETSP0125-20121206/13869_1 /TAXON_ID=485358 ORGANISM="Aristerostoma sp., Strain ATCC 50986" /NCGR_SAMPLE_ID=MMETSP0125 /ASSEMBLY_ACC=CAM_ASM_000245 /LENGTH=66 /DNA_ID=CAMNT_0001790291 /DNA_START=3700 /DNA_END=3900 /DNA_ORIENTATION=+